MSRTQAHKWLAGQMGISTEQCHQAADLCKRKD